MGHSYVSLRMMGRNSPSNILMYHLPLYIKETHTDGCSTVENLYVSPSNIIDNNIIIVTWPSIN